MSTRTRRDAQHGQRGQAVVETVIFLPMFLLALFGIIWAVQESVQYERVESAVRYAGLISQEASPYTEYSLYAMYGQLGSQVVPTVTCVLPLVTPLSDAAPTYYSSSFPNVASQSFWTPANSGVPSCRNAGLAGLAAGTGLTQDVILSKQDPGVTSAAPVLGPLVKLFSGNITTTSADEYFFKPVGENTIIACYPTLNTQTTASLKYTTDTAAATQPVALSSVVPPITMSVVSACTTM